VIDKENEIEAIKDYLVRNRMNVDVCSGIVEDTYKLNFRLDKTPLVSVIIPNKDHKSDLKRCLESIKNLSTYDDFEIIIIDDNSVETETFKYYDELALSGIKIISYPDRFNFSAINNLGVQSASGEYYIFLNNDTKVISPYWIEELLIYAQRKEIGVVGAKLYYPNGKIQHAGVIVGIGGVAANAGRLEDGNARGYMNRYSVAQNMSAVSAACMMVPANAFHKVGGFNESYPVDFNDVDLCLRIRRANYKVVFNPYCELYHYESISRTTDTNNDTFRESVRLFQNDWKMELGIGDPFYNRNFDLNNATYKLDKGINTILFGKTVKEIFDNAELSIAKKLEMYSDINNFERSREVIDYVQKLNRKEQLSDGLSIIILNLNKPELIIPLLDCLVQTATILKQRGFELQIIVGDTGSTDESVLQHYEKLKEQITVKHDMKYHFSACNNELFNQFATKKVTLFLNNDIIFDDAVASIEFIYNQIFENSSVGIAGSYLFYPELTVQHIGVEFFKTGEANCLCFHPEHRKKIKIPQFGLTARVPAGTGASLMIRSELFIDIDGFDELFQEECQDVALCLSARRLGYEIIIAYAGTIQHLENATRPKDNENWYDRRRFIRKWRLFISEVL
jgi:GT2 family glycosyltransferase